MKKRGSICEINTDRDQAIMRVYKCLTQLTRNACIDTLSYKVAAHACPRFWVSEERATSVISGMIRGVARLDSMHPTKRRMFVEIFQRVEALRRQRPADSLYSLVSEVVNQPAPEFYITPRYIRDIIYANLRN